MPGNPQECRQHATNCRRLAEAASNEAARQTFANLAETWERLASELESAQRFLQTMDDIAHAEPTSLNGPRPSVD
jgi:hypothetical protein